MNFQQSFLLNPYEKASGQDPNSLRKKLELTDEEFEFIKQDSKRLSGSSGDQYKMLQKLITEKFLFASVKHYLRTQNKTYFTDDEKKVLGEVMSSEYAAKLTANGTGRSLRAIVAKRVPPLFAREIYPIVSTGIWSNNETVNFLSALPKKPVLYSAFETKKKTGE
jgi:hypothetical protein